MRLRADCHLKSNCIWKFIGSILGLFGFNLAGAGRFDLLCVWRMGELHRFWFPSLPNIYYTWTWMLHCNIASFGRKARKGLVPNGSYVSQT